MKRIVLASGGLDSSTLLAILPKDNTVALFFDYGQRCVEQERKAIQGITDKLGIPLVERNIKDVFCSSKSDIIRKIPKNEDKKRHEVECRNLVFVAVAISTAMQLFPCDEAEVVMGVIKVGVPYADCSKDFVEQCRNLSNLCTNGKVIVTAPFLDKGKDEVFEIMKGTEIQAIETWSCYYGEEKPCGCCPACKDRQILGV